MIPWWAAVVVGAGAFVLTDFGIVGLYTLWDWNRRRHHRSVLR